MTTEQLEQLMQAHKCYFCVFSSEEGYACELTPNDADNPVGYGNGPTVEEAVYEALKSKLGAPVDPKDITLSTPDLSKLTQEDWDEAKRLGLMDI